MRREIKRATALVLALFMALNMPLGLADTEYQSDEFVLPPIGYRLALNGVSASQALYLPQETITWTVDCTGAQAIAYQVTAPDGSSVSGELQADQHTITHVAQQPGDYVLVVTATSGETSYTATHTATVISLLSVQAATSQRYAVANEQPIQLNAAIEGGAAPYTATLSVVLAGEEISQQQLDDLKDGLLSYSYMPTQPGDHHILVSVKDAAGQLAQAGIALPVAITEYEYEQDWERKARVDLTGDWRDDLVAVALTQLGYEESDRNFIITEEGKRQGYTRYGDWFGADYSDWCAMFISFCLHYADVPAFPYEASVPAWMDALAAYMRTDDYQPQKGDLVFFTWTDGHPDHVAIVESVDGDTLHVIEGNNGPAVQRSAKSLADDGILAYASLTDAMIAAGKCICRSDNHAEGCPQYVAPVCTCNASQGEQHAKGCPLYSATAPVDCTCEGLAEVDGVAVHAEGCPLYIAPSDPFLPVCSCEVADGEPHAEGCPLYEAPELPQAPACNCEAADDAPHAPTCPLYLPVDELGDSETSICTCGSIPHQDYCSQYVAITHLTAQAQGVQARAALANAPDGAAFAVATIAEGEAAFAQAKDAVALYAQQQQLNLVAAAAFDLHLADADGAVLPYTGAADVTLTFDPPILPGAQRVVMLHIAPDGAHDVTKQVTYSDGGVTAIALTTPGFSTFVAVDLAAQEPQGPACDCLAEDDGTGFVPHWQTCALFAAMTPQQQLDALVINLPEPQTVIPNDPAHMQSVHQQVEAIYQLAEANGLTLTAEQQQRIDELLQALYGATTLLLGDLVDGVLNGVVEVTESATQDVLDITGDSTINIANGATLTLTQSLTIAQGVTLTINGDIDVSQLATFENNGILLLNGQYAFVGVAFEDVQAKIPQGATAYYRLSSNSENVSLSAQAPNPVLALEIGSRYIAAADTVTVAPKDGHAIAGIAEANAVDPVTFTGDGTGAYAFIMPERPVELNVTSGVAKVGEVGYPTVQAAIDVAQSSGETVTMIANSQENVSVSGTVTLDLNGYMLQSAKSGKSVISIGENAELTVQDSRGNTEPHNGYVSVLDTQTGAGLWQACEKGCTEHTHTPIAGGLITGGNKTNGAQDTNQVGAAIMVKGGTLKLTGGTVAGNYSSYAGNIRVDSGTFEMSGGAIQYNRSSRGGAFSLANEAVAKISNGVIQYNYALTGGGISFKTNTQCRLEMSGGTIQYNYSSSQTSDEYGGGGMRIPNGTTVVFSGGVIRNNLGPDGNPDNVRLLTNGRFEVADTISANTKIGIRFHNTSINSLAAGTVTFVPFAATTIAANKTYFDVDNVPTGDNRYVIAHKDNQLGLTLLSTRHEHNGILLEPWNEVNKLPDSGSYYLLNDITLSDTWTPTGDVHLCVNNYVVTTSNNTRVVEIPSGVTVNIYDGATSSKYFTKSGEHGEWKYDPNATSTTANTVSLSGGLITGGILDSGDGSAVLVRSGGVLNLTDGNIAGNVTHNGSGAVCVESGAKVTLSGGAVIAYNASTTGGGMVVNGELTMTNGVVRNNTATTGGGIAVTGGKVTLTGGVIRDNTAQQGGGVYVGNTSAVSIGGGSINANVNHYDNADNVYLQDGSKLTLTGMPSTPIGIRTENLPTAGQPVAITNTSSVDYASAFVSDHASFQIQPRQEADGQYSVQLSKITEANQDLIFDMSRETLSHSLLLTPNKAYTITVSRIGEFTLTDPQTVHTNAASAGSATANSTFALTVEGTNTQTISANGSYTVTANAVGDITFRLAHYEAITLTDAEKQLLLEVSIEPVDAASETNKAATLYIKRKAAQLNATVPLVLLMKTNMDGGVANMDGVDYGITNTSAMNIHLTHVVETPTATGTLNRADSLANVDKQENQYWIEYADTMARDGNGKLNTPIALTPGQKTDNPIREVRISPLTFYTPNDPKVGLHFATITYTVAVPE